jgi:putative transposase
LPNNSDEDITQANHERRAQWLPLRNRKQHLGVVWLVIERTLAWIGRYRRMSKDYEYLTSSTEAVVYLTMLRLILTRLAKQNEKQFVSYKQKRAA